MLVLHCIPRVRARRQRVVGATPIIDEATCAAILDGAIILSAHLDSAPLQKTIQMGPGQFQQGYDGAGSWGWGV